MAFDFSSMGGDAQGKASAGGDVFADVMNFMGSMLAMDASTKAAQSDMAMMDQNARLAAVAAADAERRGNIEAGKLRMRGSQMVGEQALAFTEGGVDATTGTPAQAAGATAALAELDAQTAANNAYREAYGLRAQESRFKDLREQKLDEWKQKHTMYSLNQHMTIAKFAVDSARAGGGG